MIGHGEIRPEQPDDRPDQTLGLTQGKGNTARRVSAVAIARADSAAGRRVCCAARRATPRSPPR